MAQSILRYETIHFGTLNSPLQRRVIEERLTADSLKISIFEYRLDEAAAPGSPDSMKLGISAISLAGVDSAALDSARTALIATPISRVMADHTMEYLGEIDTIVGLPSYKYAVVSQGITQFLVWMAEAPKGFERITRLESMEYAGRNTTYLVEEQIRNMVRLVLLKGVTFPPNSDKTSVPLIITRLDTAVRTQAFNFRDNTYLVELKGLSVK